MAETQAQTSLSLKMKSDDPRIITRWKRFPNGATKQLRQSFKKATAYAIVGGKGKGKSSLAETIANKYETVIDIYGSRDNEGLAWCRSPKQKSVLLLKGSSVKLDCNCADVLSAVEVTPKILTKYQAVVSCAAFYTNMQEEWYSLGKLMDRLWQRTSWTIPMCVLIREASNLLYSRVSLGDNQQAAKNYIIYVLREMRHCGYALVLDTLRWHSIDIDVRTLADYTFLKAQGIEGLPRSLRFVYAFYSPRSMMRLPPEGFVVLNRDGPIGHGYFDFPPWHKLESENMIEHFDVHITGSEIPYSGDNSAIHVSDYEHVRIVKARIAGEGGMEKLGEKLGRSSKTVFQHLKKHNAMVASVGECDKCKRVNFEFATRLIE